MASLSKLTALTLLSATAVLGAACATSDESPLPAPEAAVCEPVDACSEATGEAADAQWWGERWRYCRPFRRCVYRYGYDSCARWMPQHAYYCSGYPGYPGGGYPGGGYPGGGYPGGGYPGGGYPGGGQPGGGNPGGGGEPGEP